MFKGLMDFGMKRTKWQAFGFYLAYLFVTILCGMLAGTVASLLLLPQDATFEAGMEMGNRFGTVTAIIVCAVVCGAVVQGKHRNKQYSGILLVLFSGILAFLLGGLAGLIPAAVLTTKPKH